MRETIKGIGLSFSVLVLFVFGYPSPVNGQPQKDKKYENIVPNYGFEDYASPPIGWFYTGKQFSRIAKYWFSATTTSPDLYGPRVHVPVAWKEKGFGRIRAYEGESYVGITTYGCTTGKPHCKEYIEVQLKETLVPGQRYQLSMQINQLPNAQPSNNLGVHFTEERLFYPDERLIDLTPTIQFNQTIKTHNRWIPIKHQFLAKDEAVYMTIGNFRSDDITMTEDATLKYSYYYLDQIELRKLPPIIPVPIRSNDLANAKLKIGKIIALNHVYFDFDKAQLHPRSFKELNTLVRILKNDPTMEIELQGHTDDMGSDEYNRKLSLKRALSIRTYLIDHGIDKNRVKYIGKGASEPMATNDTDKGRQKNRRVEFKILKMNKDASAQVPKLSPRSGL